MADQQKSPWIVNTTTESFQKDVLDKSQETLVVVDFWATWCQPCLMLMPVMEKVVNDFAGRFELVKVDIDQSQAIAQQFGISSVPTVLAFYGGNPIDAFQGMVPEDHLKQWVERLLLAVDVEQAKSREDEDPAAAEATYRRVLELQPNETSILVGLGRVLLAQQRHDEAQAIIDQLEADNVQDPEIDTLKAKLEFDEHQGDDIQQLRDEAAQAPDDLAAQKRLAEGLASRGEHVEALDICLALIEKDPKGVGDEARKLMIDVFRILPEASDIVKTYRAKLTTLLF